MSNMSNQKSVTVTIYQADYDNLMNTGLLLKMHDFRNPFKGPLPQTIYHSVWDGDVVIDLPENTKDDFNELSYILEHLFMIFNNKHPANYRARSLSVGDVVELDGKLYLCSVFGYKPTSFVKEWPVNRGDGNDRT